MIQTLFTICEQSLMHLPLMLGAYMSFSLIKVPDLSIESAYVVGATLGSKILIGMHGMPMGITLFLVIAASLIGGALVGLTSSLLTQKAKLPHLLSSIVTFGVFHGITHGISQAYVSLSSIPSPLEIGIATTQNPELPILIVIGVVVCMLVYFLLQTQLGFAFAVYGNNPQFFKHYGISTTIIFIVGICMSNALAGLSGYLFAQSNNFIELNMGLGKALLCITALILGKSLMRSKKPIAITIPIIGTFSYFTLQQLLLKIGFNLKYFTAMQACIVLIILIYTYRYTQRPQSNDNLGV